MSKPDHTRVIRFAEAQAGIPGPGGERSISFLQRGSLDVKLSRPLAPNQQTPHAQDEVYIVIHGRAASCLGTNRTSTQRCTSWVWLPQPSFLDTRVRFKSTQSFIKKKLEQ